MNYHDVQNRVFSIEKNDSALSPESDKSWVPPRRVNAWFDALIAQRQWQNVGMLLHRPDIS